MNDPYNIYFSTATILKWQPLLENDSFKDIIITSLQTLTQQSLLTVFGYVIMPNHIHIIWSESIHNRKESVYASFFKFTAHQFQKKLRERNENHLSPYFVNKNDRKYQFWQRNPVNIDIYNERIFEQKLNYIHENPLQPKWKLVDNPVEYRYSSVAFYELGKDEFGILTNYYFV
jgi:putative transposase